MSRLIVLLVVAAFSGAAQAAEGLASLLFEPNLLEKNKKPLNKVRIDWSHPLAHGLSYALVLNEGAGNPINLVTGKSVGTSTNWQVGSHGIEITDTQYISVEPNYPGRVAHSVFVYGVPNTSNIDYVIMQTGGWVVQGWLDYFYSGGNKLRVCVHAGSIVCTSGDLEWSTPFNRPMTAGFSVTWNGTNFDTVGFMNGLSEDIGNGGSNSGSQDLHILDNNAGTKPWSGEVYVYYLWKNRTLSPAENASLHSDPYQFLIPDIPDMAFKVPDESTAPIWLFQRRTHGLR